MFPIRATCPAHLNILTWPKGTIEFHNGDLFALLPSRRKKCIPPKGGWIMAEGTASHFRETRTQHQMLVFEICFQKLLMADTSKFPSYFIFDPC
jgi:hypothetical protein